MRSRTSTGYVLAGIDGGRSDTDALAWAMEAAARRGAECVIAGPDAVLDTAAERARARHPDVAVRTLFAETHLADLLVREAADAEVTVIGAGARHHSGLGATAARVLDHAAGPVVVVRGQAVPRVRAIAVGVDGSTSAQDACAFAVEEARLAGARLVAAASYWRPDPPYGAVHLSSEGVSGRRSAAEQTLAETTGPYRRKYPEVPISAAVSAQPPSVLLGDLSGQDVDLVVVGDRGHGRLARLALGTVSRGLAHHARCPVAIVRARTAGRRP